MNLIQYLLAVLLLTLRSQCQSDNQPPSSSASNVHSESSPSISTNQASSTSTDNTPSSEDFSFSTPTSTSRPVPKAASGPITARPQKGSSSVRSPSVNPTSIPKSIPIEASSESSTSKLGSLCKTVVGDGDWPKYEVWIQALPNVKPVAVIGRDAHPNYFLGARNINEVKDAVNFVNKYHIRLSVISSGQDYLGRNNAPNGLLLSVKHLKGIRVEKQFEATQNGLNQVDFDQRLASVFFDDASNNSRAAVTFGAGVTSQELNDALESARVFTMGPASGDISVAGGWSQAGGHGPLTSTYGLGADQVLEYQVVTADGELKIANTVTNSDLFWALRGGGGGTYGIVVQATVKTYPSPAISVSSFWLNTTKESSKGEIYPAAAYLHSQFQALNSQGVQGYYFLYPKAIRGVFLLEDKGTLVARRIWQPVFRQLQRLPGIAPVIQRHERYSNFKEFSDAMFGMLNQTDYDSDEKCKRRLDWHPTLFECEFNSTTLDANRRKMQRARRIRRQRPKPTDVLDPRPASRSSIDSQLLGASHLQDLQLAGALEAAMPRSDKGDLLPDAVLRGYLTAGPGVMKQSGSSVHPSWRRSYVLLVGTNLTSIRAISRDMGSYLDEGYWNVSDWRNLFWGRNYDQLDAIKKKYDPEHLFFVAPGIGADFWTVDASRLCRHNASDQLNHIEFELNATRIIPQSDNQNLIQARNFTTFLTSWPEKQAIADANAGAARHRLNSLREVSSRLRPTPVPSNSTRGSMWRPTPVLTPISVVPKLPDWTPAVGENVPWGGFTAVPTDISRGEGLG